MPPQEFKPKPMGQLEAGSKELNSQETAIREIIRSRVKTFNPFRRSRIPEWNINIAYLCGHQYIKLTGGGQMVKRKTGPFASTVNKIAPAVRNDVALATKVPPKFDVVPDSTDTNDKATAIAGNKMAGYLRRINNFDSARGRIIIWYDISKIGWRKQWWDPQYKVIGHNPEPEDTEGHNPDMPAGAPIYQGEAKSDHVPTNEMIWDWRQNTDKLSWAIHARPMSIGEIKNRYGEEKALAIPDSEYLDPSGSMNEFEITVFSEFTQFANDVTGSTVKPDIEEMANDDKEVMVYELWQIANNNYPLGVYAVQAGLEDGVVLTHGPYPIEMYPHGQVPFTGYDMMLPDKAVSGTASRISQARPLQRELNDIRTLIRENTATLGGGLWKVPRDSKLNIARMDNGVGLFVEYDGPYEPHREAGVPVAGQLFVYVATIINDINDIFSFPHVAQGKRPQGGPKSGVGIAILQEAAQTQHSPIIKEMDRKDEMAMTQLLSIAFANYGERTFNIVGKDNQWTLFEFDPKSYNTNYNVIVRSGSSMPVSQAIERELAIGLYQSGMLGNPADPSIRKSVLGVIDIGGLDTILKDKSKDVAFAKKEFQVPVQQYNQLMENVTDEGQLQQAINKIYFPAVNVFDDHEIHIIEHKEDILDKYWEYLATGDPGYAVIANSMVAHWNQHSMILQQQMLQNAIITGQIKREDLESSREKESAKNEGPSEKSSQKD